MCSANPRNSITSIQKINSQLGNAMKAPVKFLSKVSIAAVVFAQTSTADTGLPMMGESALNEPLYLTLCGLGLLVIGLRSNKA